MDRYFDKQGIAIKAETGEQDDCLKWGRMFEDKEYCQIAETTLADGTYVSTVWLGLNHRFTDGPPLIFETMTFSPNDNMDEQDQERYSTEEEALAGHQRMVEKWSRPS